MVPVTVFQDVERHSSLGSQPAQVPSPHSSPHAAASQQNLNPQNSDANHFLGERTHS